MKPVDTEFIQDKKKNKQTDRNPDGEARDVNKGKNFVLHQVSPRNAEIAFNHVICFFTFFNSKTLPWITSLNTIVLLGKAEAILSGNDTLTVRNF